jgi:hypothetical protein
MINCITIINIATTWPLPTNTKVPKHTQNSYGMCDLHTTLKWRKYVWTGECNVYILTMKINRTMWLIGVINLFRR